ncbi:MAG: hypothetical protein O7E52_03025 [Candidatus Poribacteria bacterium]|nr:hypothetical protein [Candidatus Poribacteria bacterium]
MSFIIPKGLQRAFLFFLTFSFLILHFPKVNAEPVRKDSALTQHYIKRRSSSDTDEANEEKSDLSAESERSKTQDFWGTPTSGVDRTSTSDATEDDPWKVQTEDKPAPPEEETPEQDIRLEMLTPYFEALRRWKAPPRLLELRELDRMRDGKQEEKEKGLALPLDSNLQITGHKSVTIEINKTHYFGQSDVNRFGAGFAGRSFGSGLDLGLTSSYTYDRFSDFGGGYGGGYGSYGGGFGRPAGR